MFDNEMTYCAMNKIAILVFFNDLTLLFFYLLNKISKFSS